VETATAREVAALCAHNDQEAGGGHRQQGQRLAKLTSGKKGRQAAGIGPMIAMPRPAKIEEIASRPTRRRPRTWDGQARPTGVRNDPATMRPTG